MAEPRTVYAVVSGEYSDYEVYAIYERREDAEREAADPAFNLSGRVEEFEYRPASGPPLGMEVKGDG